VTSTSAVSTGTPSAGTPGTLGHGPAGRPPGGRRPPGVVVRALVALTKPRIIELLLVTTVPAMLLAQRGVPSVRLVLVTLVGGTLAAGSANTTQLTQLYSNMTSAMYENYTDIWLVVPTSFAVYSTHLHGFVQNPMASAEPFAFLFNTQWLSS